MRLLSSTTTFNEKNNPIYSSNPVLAAYGGGGEPVAVYRENWCRQRCSGPKSWGTTAFKRGDLGDQDLRIMENSGVGNAGLRKSSYNLAPREDILTFG